MAEARIKAEFVGFQVPVVCFPLLLVTLRKPQKLKFCEDKVRVISERFGIILQIRAGDVIMVIYPKGKTK